MPGSCRGFAFADQGLPPPRYSPVAHTAPRARPGHPDAASAPEPHAGFPPVDYAPDLSPAPERYRPRRSIACAAPRVCSVANTRWPVSAAVSAGAYRLAVAQLTKQNHIRIFTQSAAQGLGKGRAVQAYLPLLDQATFTLVHKLHRIFRGSEYARPSGD